MSIRILKPSEVDLDTWLCGSDFGTSELERIAMNITNFSREKLDNQWTTFSREDYQAFCGYQVEESESSDLNKMVTEGFLDLEKEMFSVNLRFVGFLWKFLDTPEKKAKKQESERKKEELKEKVQNFKKDIESHVGELTFEDLDGYAHKYKHYAAHLVLDDKRILVYITGGGDLYTFSFVADGKDMQTAIEEIVKVIREDERYL